MMSDQNRDDARSRRRRQRRGYALLILAAGMLAFGVAAGTLYYVLRPTTLRIAVGPAGSEGDLRGVAADASVGVARRSAGDEAILDGQGGSRVRPRASPKLTG